MIGFTTRTSASGRMVSRVRFVRVTQGGLSEAVTCASYSDTPLWNLTMTSDDDLLRAITERIVERFHPTRIVLFGSRARGDADDDSDYDLFVEMPSRKSSAERIADVLALFGLREWSLDVVVYTPEEARRWREAPGSFLSQIESEGRILYDGDCFILPSVAEESA